MPKRITKIITIGLIVSLLLPRGFVAVSPAFADETPTSVPEAPASDPASGSGSEASAPKEERVPTSPPQPSQPEQPSTVPKPSQTGPQPSSAPQPSQPEQPSTVPKPSQTGPQQTQAEEQSTVSPTGGEPMPTSGQSASVQGSVQGDALSGTSSGSSGGSGAVGSSFGSAGGSVNDPYNTLTGPFSSNAATEKTEKSLDTLNKNLAELNNTLNLITATGFANANYNTLPGNVFTGNVESTINLLNKLNSTVNGIGAFSVYNVYGTHVGDIMFGAGSGSATDSFASASGQISKNAVTGPGSSNVATADDTFTIKEANGNDAKITNDIVLKAITGGNSASFNTLGGLVKTGNASALANIINMVNTNIHAKEWLIGVVNVFGSLYGNIILPDTADSGTVNQQTTTVNAGNTMTGPLSTNTTEITNTDIATFNNVNSADVTTTIDLAANTGNNDASYNTYGGSIETGNAQGLINNTSVANVNTVDEDGTVYMVIVNEMGKWVGKIIGAPWDTNSYSNSLPYTADSSTGSSQSFTVDAGSAATGPLSDNYASYESYNEQTTANTNTAVIENNITVEADTGNNTAQYNTGPGSITTGNAKAGVNMFNLANVNVTAKKFVALFVNVLGSFFGDVVPPGEDPQRQIPGPQQNDDGNADGHTGDPGSGTNPDSGGSEPPDGVSPVLPTFSHSENNPGIQSQPNNPAPSATAGSARVAYRQRIPAGSRTPRTTAHVSAQQEFMTPTVTPSKLRRGIFISPAFAAAGESTPFASLFGGARINVTYAWLAVIPFTIGLLYLRRRHKIDLSKYVNGLLNVLL